jgi:Lon protease-like protein
MLTKLSTIPLFPLSQTLYPAGALDLKIFEVRYLDMIKDCIANSTTFGIVTLDEGKEIAEPGEKPAVFFPTGTLVDITYFDTPQPSLFFIKCQTNQSKLKNI